MKTKKIKAQTILEKIMQRERESMRQIPSLPEAGDEEEFSFIHNKTHSMPGH
jgi:hypothetical protein